MTTPKHTTRAYIEHAADQAVTFTVAPTGGGEGRWSRLLSVFVRVYMPLLNGAEIKTFLTISDRYADLGQPPPPHPVYASGPYLLAATKIAPRTLQAALRTLQDHPDRLLAAAPSCGEWWWVPMPDHWAEVRGRSLDPPPRAPKCADAQLDAHQRPALKGSRAHQPKDIKNLKPERNSYVESGWSDPQLYGDGADPRYVLGTVYNVGGQLLEETLALPGLTIEKIHLVAQAVDRDPTAENRPVCLCARLFGLCGGSWPPESLKTRESERRRDAEAKRATQTLAVYNARMKHQMQPAQTQAERLSRLDELQRQLAAVKGGCDG